MPVAWRLGLYYAALFIGSGASGPYAGVWFHAHGLTGAEIGLILAAPALGRALTGPGAALWADGFELRRTPLTAIAAVVAGLYAALGLAHGFWTWFGLWFAAQSLLANLSPLADVITLRRARADGFHYGRPRGIGSAAFVLGNVGMGFVIGLTSPDALIVWITAAAAAASLAARWLLPPDLVHEAGERPPGLERLKGLGALTADPVLMLAVVSVGLIQASHGFYNGFSVLAWKRQGLAPGLAGTLWGLAVTAEVAFLWFMEPLRRRLGPVRLVILGGAGAVVRWTALAFSPPLGIVVLLQLLHALSFTATFLGSLQLIERLTPPTSASAAQTLNSVLSGGLLIGLSTVASGHLYDWVGASGYLAMSAIALAGLLGALCLARLQRVRNAGATFDRA